jgi:hypothetical protein
MIWQDGLLFLLLGIISLICFSQAYKGYRTKIPPFQKGLKGTALAESAKLCMVQVACALLLGVATLGMMVFLYNAKLG